MTRPTRVPAPVTRATRPFRSMRSSPLGVRSGGESGYPPILFPEPFSGDVHHPQAPGSVVRAVPVRATARKKVEEICESLQPLHVFSGVTGMPYLDSIEPGGHEGFQPFSASAVTRVRPYGDGASLVRDCNGVFDGELVFTYERAAVGSQITHEGVSEIRDHSPRNECARDVWPPDGTAVR